MKKVDLSYLLYINNEKKVSAIDLQHKFQVSDVAVYKETKKLTDLGLVAKDGKRFILTNTGILELEEAMVVVNKIYKELYDKLSLNEAVSLDNAISIFCSLTKDAIVSIRKVYID